MKGGNNDILLKVKAELHYYMPGFDQDKATDAEIAAMYAELVRLRKEEAEKSPRL